MMIYLDRSFCSAFSDGRCVNADCDRAFTLSHNLKAARWAMENGLDGAPVGVADFSPDCKIMITPKASA